MFASTILFLVTEHSSLPTEANYVSKADRYLRLNKPSLNIHIPLGHPPFLFLFLLHHHQGMAVLQPLPCGLVTSELHRH